MCIRENGRHLDDVIKKNKYKVFYLKWYDLTFFSAQIKIVYV